MEWKLNSVTSISKKDRVRTVNNLLKIKLQVMALQLVVLLERNFRYTQLHTTSLQTTSLLVAGSGRSDTTKLFYQRLAKHLKIRRRKAFAWAFPSRCSAKIENVRAKYQNHASVTSVTMLQLTSLKGVYLFGEPCTYCFARAPQG